MNYLRRRVYRKRMTRRNAINNNIRHAAATIRGFIPDVAAAIAFMVAVFFLFPILSCMGVIP